MNSLVTWIILGLVFYLVFARQGDMGMGCCGGGRHDPNNHPGGPAFKHSGEHRKVSTEAEDNFIDLKKDNDKIVSPEDRQVRDGNR